jgi:hypothetical protein
LHKLRKTEWAMAGSRIFGKKAKVGPAPPGIYRDDPSRDDAESVSAMSLHSDIGASGVSDEDLLPPYTDNPVSESNHPDVDRTYQLDPKDQVLVHIDNKGSAEYRLSESLTSDPVLLEKFVRAQEYRAPKACISIQGWHNHTTQEKNKTKTEKVIDFDIKIDVTDTICRDTIVEGEPQKGWTTLQLANNDAKTYRGTIMKSKNKNLRADIEGNSHKPTLQEWCHLFCANGSKLKA